MKVSVIIPSYKDPLLQKTIDDLLAKSELGDDLEIIAVLDGYWPNPPLLFSEEANKHVVQVHLGKNRGMRGAINAGVSVARGEFIMRTDEHCIFGQGYDRILTERFKDNWIVYPVRYYLDTEKWEIMDKKPNVYNKLIIDPVHNKFASVPWKSREEQRKKKMIDDSMAMQGSCWIMKRSWWDKVIVELQSEGYGTHYQDSHEMVFKTWQAGGRLLVNKNTWHAHRDRTFNRTHNYPRHLSDASFEYSLKIWKEYYDSVIRPLWKI